MTTESTQFGGCLKVCRKLIVRMIPGPLEKAVCLERSVWLICGKAEPECSAARTF